MKKDLHLEYRRFSKNSIIGKGNSSIQYAKSMKTLQQNCIWMTYSNIYINNANNIDTVYERKIITKYRCSIPFVIKKMQIKATIKYLFTPIRIPKIKKTFK